MLALVDILREVLVEFRLRHGLLVVELRVFLRGGVVSRGLLLKTALDLAERDVKSALVGLQQGLSTFLDLVLLLDELVKVQLVQYGHHLLLVVVIRHSDPWLAPQASLFEQALLDDVLEDLLL